MAVSLQVNLLRPSTEVAKIPKIAPLSAIKSRPTTTGTLRGPSPHCHTFPAAGIPSPSRPFLIDDSIVLLNLTSNSIELSIEKAHAYSRNHNCFSCPNLVLESQRHPSNTPNGNLETLCANDATVHLTSNRSRPQLPLRSAALCRFNHIYSAWTL